MGCGTIGVRLAVEIDRESQGVARLIGVYDHRLQKATRLIRKLSSPVPILKPQELIQKSDLVIEAASADAVGQLLPSVIAQRKSLLLLSTGGLLGQAARLKKARRLKIPIYLPSGALAGLDGVKAAAAGRISSVTLTTRKPPRAFEGAPGLKHRKIPLGRISSPRLLFEGSAAKAVKIFPQNINVAATLALAGIGPRRTRVRILADPGVRQNVHEIEVVGSFGRLVSRTENRPSLRNPKTSTLAVLSALTTLRQVLQPLRIGT